MAKVTYTKSTKTPSGITKTVSRGSTWSIVKLPVYVLLTWLLILGPIFAIQTTFENGQVVLAENFQTSEFEPGILENYLVFNGVGDYIHSIDKTFFTDNSYMEFRFLASFDDFSIVRSLLWTEESGPWFALVGTTSRQVGFTITTNNGTQDVFSNINVLDVDTIHDIRFIYDNPNIYVYVDGIEVINQNVGSIVSFTSDPTNIARRPNDSLYFKGKLYDVKFYKDSNNNLVTHYDFSDGSGSILTDVVNNNNGTIVGATWVSNVISAPVLQRDYYDIMENARTAEYGNIFSAFEFLLNIPSIISNSQPLAFVGNQNTFSELWDTITNITSLPSLLPNLPMFGGTP